MAELRRSLSHLGAPSRHGSGRIQRGQSAALHLTSPVRLGRRVHACRGGMTRLQGLNCSAVESPSHMRAADAHNSVPLARFPPAYTLGRADGALCALLLHAATSPTLSRAVSRARASVHPPSGGCLLDAPGLGPPLPWPTSQPPAALSCALPADHWACGGHPIGRDDNGGGPAEGRLWAGHAQHGGLQGQARELPGAAPPSPPALAGLDTRAAQAAVLHGQHESRLCRPVHDPLPPNQPAVVLPPVLPPAIAGLPSLTCLSMSAPLANNQWTRQRAGAEPRAPHCWRRLCSWMARWWFWMGCPTSRPQTAPAGRWTRPPRQEPHRRGQGAQACPPAAGGQLAGPRAVRVQTHSPAFAAASSISSCACRLPERAPGHALWLPAGRSAQAWLAAPPPHHHHTPIHPPPSRAHLFQDELSLLVLLALLIRHLVLPPQHRVASDAVCASSRAKEHVAASCGGRPG